MNNNPKPSPAEAITEEFIIREAARLILPVDARRVDLHIGDGVTSSGRARVLLGGCRGRPVTYFKGRLVVDLAVGQTLEELWADLLRRAATPDAFFQRVELAAQLRVLGTSGPECDIRNWKP